MDSRTAIFIEALNAVDVVYSSVLWNGKPVERTDGGTERVRTALNGLLCVAPPEVALQFVRCIGLGTTTFHMEDLIVLRDMIRKELGLGDITYMDPEAVWLGKISKRTQ